MSDKPSRSDRWKTHASDGGSDEHTTLVERLLMAMSVLFTIVLFTFVLWQASTTPVTAEPTATVTGTEPLPTGNIRVTVVLQNGQGVGLVMATVEVDCDTPPPELTFEHVPADDRRSGYVVCPSGVENPTATISTWTEA